MWAEFLSKWLRYCTACASVATQCNRIQLCEHSLANSYKIPLFTVLCKSNGSEFQQNSWLFGAFLNKFCLKRICHRISLHFCDADCSNPRELSNNNLLCSIICRKFVGDNLLLQIFAAIFWTIICSSRKFTVIFQIFFSPSIG